MVHFSRRTPEVATCFSAILTTVRQVPVVRRLGNFIQWISHYSFRDVVFLHSFTTWMFLEWINTKILSQIELLDIDLSTGSSQFIKMATPFEALLL